MRTVRRNLAPRVRIGVIILLVLIMGVVLLRYGGGQTVSWVARPLAAVGTWFQDQFGPKQSLNDITRERDQLRDQLLAVSQRLATTQHQLEAVHALDQLETFLENQNIQADKTFVIGYSPDPGIQSIVIQLGEQDGIRVGQAVITETGVVVGVVTRVDASTSTVRLVIDSQSRILAKLQNDTQSRGIIVGERGISISMQFIPRNETVEQGTTAVTSGLDPLIPPDLLIGTIQETTTRAGELFQSAVIQSPIEFRRLSVVAVVHPRL